MSEGIYLQAGALSCHHRPLTLVLFFFGITLKFDCFYGFQSWTSDIVEPFDFEDFLSQYQLLIDRDPLRNILDIPLGDVEVEIIERPIRTLRPIVPEENM